MWATHTPDRALEPRRHARALRTGQNNMPAINSGRTHKPAAAAGGGLTSGQKALAALAAVLCGPAVLKKVMESPVEKVDLSSFNIVSKYDTPAIERRDSTLRIEFCSS